MNYNSKDIQLDLPEDFDDRMFEEGRGSQFPMVLWESGNSRDGRAGHFIIKADSVTACPPGWISAEHRFGQDPNRPKDKVYTTSIMRCVLLGYRSRVRFSATDGSTWYFPPFTSRAKCVNSYGEALDGKYDTQNQLAVLVAGMDSPVVLSMNGTLRSTSWDNDPSRNTRFPGFDWGVKQIVSKFAADAAKQHKRSRLPIFCMWWIDLLPAKQKNGDPMFIKFAGKDFESFANPFTVDLSPAEGMSTRYVGKDNYPAFESVRHLATLDWEDEWKGDFGQAVRNGDAAVSSKYKDDEIPF